MSGSGHVTRGPGRHSLALRTRSADETRALAGTLAGSLRAGDVVSLTGELGAGKTCFVQGAAAALQVGERVTSPTFTLVRSYRGRTVAQPPSGAGGKDEGRTVAQPPSGAGGAYEGRTVAAGADDATHTRGREVTVAHVDVYRLDRLQEVLDLGEDVIAGPEQITFIEWGDTLGALLPADRLEVEFHLGDDPDERLLVLRGAGTWEARLARAGLGRWDAEAAS